MFRNRHTGPIVLRRIRDTIVVPSCNPPDPRPRPCSRTPNRPPIVRPQGSPPAGSRREASLGSFRPACGGRPGGGSGSLRLDGSGSPGSRSGSPGPRVPADSGRPLGSFRRACSRPHARRPRPTESFSIRFSCQTLRPIGFVAHRPTCAHPSGSRELPTPGPLASPIVRLFAPRRSPPGRVLGFVSRVGGQSTIGRTAHRAPPAALAGSSGARRPTPSRGSSIPILGSFIPTVMPNCSRSSASAGVGAVLAGSSGRSDSVIFGAAGPGRPAGFVGFVSMVDLPNRGDRPHPPSRTERRSPRPRVGGRPAPPHAPCRSPPTPLANLGPPPVSGWGPERRRLPCRMVLLMACSLLGT